MPLITISQGIGCGGMVIAGRVADALGLELFDDDKLLDEANKMGIRPEAIEDVDKKAPDLFHLILSKKPEIYLDYMESVVYALAAKGQGIIIGHGSQVLLREFDCALHVRVNSGESSRIENLMKEKHLSRDAAQNLIRKGDHEQSGFFQYAFHLSWKDSSLYDLVINTEKIGYEPAAKLIIEAFRSDQVTACSLRAVDIIKRLSLRKEINALLLENNLQIKWLDIEVRETGVVSISGFIYSQEDKDKALNIVRSIPGVSRVYEDIGIMSHLS